MNPTNSNDAFKSSFAGVPSKRFSRPHPDYSAVEVFNLKDKWHLVQPHLHHPEVTKALKASMDLYLEAHRAFNISIGSDPDFWPREYDLEDGPWGFGTSDYWLMEVDRRFEAAQDRGEVHLPPFADDGEPTEEELEVEGKLRSRFCPQPGTYEWYLLPNGCFCVVDWLCELGKQVFPTLVWDIMEGECYALAFGADEKGNIKVLFDLHSFEDCSAEELIAMATESAAEK
jgi:hypothetical protein